MIQRAARSSKGTTWCGPHALATVTGKTYDEVIKVVRSKIRRKRIKGMFTNEIFIVAKALGIKDMGVFMPMRGKRNLRNSVDWLKPNRLYIVFVTRHFVVVNTTDWTVCDNTNEWEPVTTSKLGRLRVKSYAEAIRISE